MAYEALKCPSCGADIQNEIKKEETFCEYCGTKVHWKDDSKINIQIDGIMGASQLKEIAQKAYAAQQYKQSIEKFSEVSEQDPTDHECWWGMVLCEIKLKEQNWGGLKNIADRYSILIDEDSSEYKSAIAYAPTEDAARYKDYVARYNQHFKNLIAEQEESEKYKSIPATIAIIIFEGIAIFILCLMCAAFFSIFLGDGVFKFGILAGLILGIGVTVFMAFTNLRN